MATDIRRIIENLLWFYEFEDKEVISVGAGGGQLIEYGRNARRVLAVDSDPSAVEALRARLKTTGLEEKFDIVETDFGRLSAEGDVVLFEFCLHEMEDPSAAILHAKSLAPDVVVLDHLPESEWAYYVGEEDKVRHSWDALLAGRIRKRASFLAAQEFSGYLELHGRVAPQGRDCVERIRRFLSDTDIVIPMSYGMALV